MHPFYLKSLQNNRTNVRFSLDKFENFIRIVIRGVRKNTSLFFFEANYHREKENKNGRISEYFRKYFGSISENFPKIRRILIISKL